MTKLVDTRPLKQFAVKDLPLTSATRAEILSEPDNVSCDDYLVLFKVCLRLLQFDTQVKHIKIEALET
jgi:hypothetical protein